MAFKSSRFFFSSVAVSSTLIEPLHTVYPLFRGQLVELPKLLVAAEHVTEDKDTDEDLKLLLAPGSSLGGARPKASVVEKDGHLAIVKFPRKDDEYNTVLWEAIALVRAKKPSIVVAEGRIETVADKPVLLLRRFDRDGHRRIPFLSAMSMIGSKDNETRSYMELVDALRQHGAAPEADMEALSRRVVFSVLISNTDDHMRNHGFLIVLVRTFFPNARPR